MADKEVTTKIIVQGETSSVTAAMGKATDSVKKAELAIADLSSKGKASVDRLQNSFDTLGIKSSLNIEAERRSLTAAFDHIKNSGVASAADVTRAQGALKTQLGTLGGELTGVSGGFGSMGVVARLAGSAFAAMGVAALAGQLHEAGMSAERLRNSFEAATGSVQKGAAEYAYARSEAQRLGLDLQSTADAYLKITASAKGTSLEGEKTQQIFSSVAGASRALGLSGDQMSGALLAISQMMSKGTVQAEELRGQLGERLPGAFQIAARSMGVTTAELGKMLEGGKVMADDFLPKFAAELQKTFPPGEKAMSGLTAETMRLKTALYELKTTTMESGGDGFLTFAIRQTRALAEEMGVLIKAMDKAPEKASYGALVLAGVVGGATYGAAGGPWGAGIGAVVGGASAMTGITMAEGVSGGIDANRKKAPLTQTDKALIGAGSNFSAMNDSLFTPQFSNRMRSPDEYTSNFGDSINRSTPYEEPKKTTTGSGAKPKDLLKDQILGYQGFMAQQAAQATKDWQEWNSDENKFLAQLAAEAEAKAIQATKDWQEWNSDDNKRVGQENSADETSQLKWRTVAEKNNAAALDSERGFIAMRAAMGQDAFSNELATLDAEQMALEQKWAMNTDSFATYEQRKYQIQATYDARRAEASIRNEQRLAQTKLQVNQNYLSGFTALANAVNTIAGGKNKVLYALTQSAAIATTFLSTQAAAASALAPPPLGLGPIAGAPLAASIQVSGYASMAAMAATTLANVAGIGSGSTPDAGGIAGAPSSGFIQQPFSASNNTVPLNVTFAPVFNGPMDQQALTRWTEDYMLPTLRDLKTRGVT